MEKSLLYHSLIACALGGGFGAVFRYITYLYIIHAFEKQVFFGTLIVNILGSFLMGILYWLMIEKFKLDEVWRCLFMVGFLGAFTTFSSFSLDVLKMLQGGLLVQAFSYTIISVVSCIFAIFLGVVISRWFFP